MLNETLLRSLVVDLGTDHVGALIGLFADDAPARIAALQAAVDTGDASQAAKVAHTMKSASTSVGALAYASRCSRIEQLARSERLDLARADVACLHDDLAAATQALASALQNGETSPGVVDR